MADIPRVLVIGAGAIGSFYGAILQRAGCRVGVVLRSDYDTVREHGFAIESPLGDLSWRPDSVHRAGDAGDGDFDYVLCCLKVLPGIDRSAELRPWVGTGTRIVLIENGIDIEREVADAFPDNPLISCLAYIAVSRVAPGQIEHKAYGRLTMGTWPQGISDDCRRLQELFEAGGIGIDLAEQIVGQRWSKSLWNTPLNPLSVLAGGADTVTLMDAPGGERLAREMMAELAAVAAADGHPLADDAVDRLVTGTRRMPAYKNSMALDYVSGRPMEIEAILGNVVRLAEHHGVDAPRLRAMHVIFAMREMQAASDAA